MERKPATAKTIRLLAAAITALLAAALLAPLAGASYDAYIENVANVNTALSKVTADEANNLYIDLMNRLYPVGSIYIATSIDDVDPDLILDSEAKMDAHFGGEWKFWGQGCVPMGAGGTMPASGGSMGDQLAASLPITASGMLRGGDSIALSNPSGSPAITDNGSVTWSAAVNLSGSPTFSGSVTLGKDNLPAHRHATKLRVQWRNWNGNGDAGWPKAWDAGTRHGTNGTAGLGKWDGTAPPAANTTPNWGAAIHNTGTGSALSISTQFAVDSNKLKVNLSDFTGTINSPGISGSTNQAVDWNTTSLSATGTGTAANVPDTTLQPYITCYMYERKELADLR